MAAASEIFDILKADSDALLFDKNRVGLYYVQNMCNAFV
jgi:hypothetical protein